jgi:hypothetical protein
VMPVLASVLLLDAISTWNEFLIAFILINHQSQQTVQIGLLNFQREFSANISLIPAGSVLAWGPMVLLSIALSSLGDSPAIGLLQNPAAGQWTERPAPAFNEGGSYDFTKQ